jgi:hypothetical protein
MVAAPPPPPAGACTGWVTSGAKAVSEQAQQVWQQETARLAAQVQQLQYGVHLGAAAPDAGTQQQQQQQEHATAPGVVLYARPVSAAAPPSQWAAGYGSAAPTPAAHHTHASAPPPARSMAPPPDRAVSSCSSLQLSDAVNNTLHGRRDSTTNSGSDLGGMTLQQTWDELCARHGVGAAVAGGAQAGSPGQ